MAEKRRGMLVVGDLFNPPPGFHGAFDWIIEHTCFCAIDPAMRPRYVQAAAALLKPGGRLFAIFYLDPAAGRQPPFGVTIAGTGRPVHAGLPPLGGVDPGADVRRAGGPGTRAAAGETIVPAGMERDCVCQRTGLVRIFA